MAALLALGVGLEAPRGTPTPLALCLERADLSTSVQLLAAAADPTARARLLGLSTVDTAHCALAIAEEADQATATLSGTRRVCLSFLHNTSYVELEPLNVKPGEW